MALRSGSSEYELIGTEATVIVRVEYPDGTYIEDRVDVYALPGDEMTWLQALNQALYAALADNSRLQGYVDGAATILEPVYSVRMASFQAIPASTLESLV